MPAGTPFKAFSINFVNGASRALAALILVEIVMTSGFTPDMMTNAEIECMRSMLYISVVFEGTPFSIHQLVFQTVAIKQGKSQTQRLDILECMELFQHAGRELRLLGSAWNNKSDADVLQAAILAYNKSCKQASCKVDGSERMAIQYMSMYGHEVQRIVRRCWNDYKVKHSPFNKTMLATNFLANLVPSGVAPCWEEAMKPTKEKLPVLFNRLYSAFTTKVMRAQQAHKCHIYLNSKQYKEEVTSDLFFACMCWSHWTPEMKSIMTPSKWDTVNQLFLHGSLDGVIKSAIRSNSPVFQAMPGFHCKEPPCFS